jgi:hypothetical protein
MEPEQIKNIRIRLDNEKGIKIKSCRHCKFHRAIGLLRKYLTEEWVLYRRQLIRN